MLFPFSRSEIKEVLRPEQRYCLLAPNHQTQQFIILTLVLSCINHTFLRKRGDKYDDTFRRTGRSVSDEKSSSTVFTGMIVQPPDWWRRMQDHYSPSQVTYCWGDLVVVRGWKLHCSCVGAWRTWEGKNCRRVRGGGGQWGKI